MNSLLNNTTQEIIIEPDRGLVRLHLMDLWKYRELLYFLTWRDIKIRYKQTALGVTWIVLQPLVSMLIYSVLFGILLKVPSNGVPYPVFTFIALLPWNYFASAVNRSSTSVVNNTNLITKVYFPRLVIPVSGVLAGLLDFLISFIFLLLLMAGYGIRPSINMFLLPLFLLLAIATALGFSLWFAALDVRFRDVQYLIPFVIQIWMYVTPVIYGSSLIPEKFRLLIALNPMTGVVEGFRWALLGGQYSGLGYSGSLFLVSIFISLAALVSGLVFFKGIESSFADII